MISRRTYRIVLAGLMIVAVHHPDAVAQTGVVAGRVADDAGRPLPGVNVVVAGSALGAATGADGSYRIASVPAGERRLAASAVGYRREVRSVFVAAGAETEVDFVLQEAAIETEEIVVTASRREESAGAVAASVRSISPRDIESRNAVALDDVLRYVPGVQMSGNQVNIRGSSGFSFNTGSRVLLLIDGMPMLRPDAHGIPFDAVPMSQVHRIEVLKGPGSALYGGGALGGVIQIITRDYPSEPETAVDVYGGAYDPVRYDVWRRNWKAAERPRAFAGISIGHARPMTSRSGLWAHLSYRFDAGHLRLSRKESLQTFAKMTWRSSPGQGTTLLGGFSRRTVDSFIYWNGARDALNPGRFDFGPDPSDTGSDDRLISELILMPSLEEVLAPDWLLAARIRIFGVAIQALDEAGRPRPLSAGTAGIRYGAELQTDYAPSASRHVTIGLTADANAARSSFFDRDDPVSQPEAAAFVQWEESLSEAITLTVGGRYDVYRIREGELEQAFSPKLSASAAVGDAWNVRAAFGDGFRVPSVAERFVTNSEYLPVTANPDLRPETSRSYELGVRGAFEGPSGRISVMVDAAGFWSDYRRLVEPTFVAAERAFRFVNLTRARIRGIEITAEVARPDGGGSVEAGYTLLDARDLSADLPLAFRSTHLLKASITDRWGRLDLGADFRYASEPRRIDSDFALFVKDADIMVPTRVLDLRVGSSWRQWRATLHLKNALDYYYLERPALLAPQRHVILQISARL